MSWWLFLPLSYLAMGLDQICASELSWRGTAPRFLLLLWSILAVREQTSRSLFQACLLGLIAELSAGQAPGVTPAVFVTTLFLLGCIRRDHNSPPLSWLWWSFPLMLIALGTVHASEWLFHSSAVSPQQLVRQSVLSVMVTFVWGIVLKLLSWVLVRIFRFRRDPVPQELEASSFFLSR